MTTPEPVTNQASSVAPMAIGARPGGIGRIFPLQSDSGLLAATRQPIHYIGIKPVRSRFMGTSRQFHFSQTPASQHITATPALKDQPKFNCRSAAAAVTFEDTIPLFPCSALKESIATRLSSYFDMSPLPLSPACAGSLDWVVAHSWGLHPRLYALARLRGLKKEPNRSQQAVARLANPQFAIRNPQSTNHPRLYALARVRGLMVHPTAREWGRKILQGRAASSEGVAPRSPRRRVGDF